jgi:hypothetical protein
VTRPIFIHERAEAKKDVSYGSILLQKSVVSFCEQ